MKVTQDISSEVLSREISISLCYFSLRYYLVL